MSRIDFEDGSYVAWVDKETLKYEINGFSVNVWVDFDTGLLSSVRVIRSDSLTRWDTYPHDSPGIIDTESRKEILQRIEDYYAAHGKRCVVAGMPMDFRARIIPGFGLGGLRIGASLDSLSLKPSIMDAANQCKVIPVLDGKVSIHFSDDNEIAQLTALPGYEGTLLDKHFVGEAISNYLNGDVWIFSESLDGFIHKDIGGVIVYANLEDATLSEIVEKQSTLIVEAISVMEHVR